MTFDSNNVNVFLQMVVPREIFRGKKWRYVYKEIAMQSFSIIPFQFLIILNIYDFYL